MTGSTVQHDPGLRITTLICEQDLSNTMPRTECNVDDGHGGHDRGPAVNRLSNSILMERAKVCTWDPFHFA